ncbi:hypothetical protein EI94DRAFT_324034, partial [Lactarius quietus]
KPDQFFNPHNNSPVFLPQFIFLHQRFRFLYSYSSKLRDIIDGRGNGAYQEILESLGAFWDESDKPENRNFSGIHRPHLMERQLWRLKDLRDGGGFGFWVELYFLVVQQLLSITRAPDVHRALIVGTFKAFTPKWREHKHSNGTQRVLLNLVCDLAIPDRGITSNIVFPRYITDELLALLENMMKGQTGAHIDEAIDEAMKELEDAIKKQATDPEWWTEIRLFRVKAVKVISRLRHQAPSPAPS